MLESDFAKETVIVEVFEKDLKPVVFVDNTIWGYNVFVSADVNDADQFLKLIVSFDLA